MNSLSRSPRLARSRDGILAGVCAGIAERFGVSPWLVRAVWLVALLAFGTGVLLYALLWWLMPHAARMPVEPAAWVKSGNGHHPPLARTSVDKKLLGVCGGVARRLGLDPTLVRLATLGLAMASFGLVVAAYLLAALILPSPERGLTVARAPFDL